MRQRRILVIHDTLMGWGAEKNLAHIGEFAPQEIFEVSYLLTAAKPAPDVTCPGGRAFRLRAPRLRVNRYSQPVNFGVKLVYSLAWLLRRRGQFDYLIVSNPEECVIAFVAKKTLRLRAKILLYSQIPLDLGPANLFLKLALRAYVAVAKRSDGILCLSQGLRDHLADAHGVRTQMFVMPSCIDSGQVATLAREAVDEGWLLRDNRPTVIYAGRLSNRQKRIDVLLQAVALLKKRQKSGPFKVLLLGDGEDRGSLEQLAQRLGLEGQVYFLGYRRNPYQYYALADLFVLSSDIEGFGNVLVEAMACGLPVVATDCHTGPREILEGGKWGQLVPTGDPALLADQIQRVLTDEALKTDLKQRSLARAKDFAPTKVFATLASICEQLDTIGRVEEVA